MTIEIIGIPLAFVFVSAMVFWFLIGAKGKWWLKAATIAVTFYLSLSVWHSMGEILGWPATTELPSKFEVHWAVIEEPDKNSNNPGAIYVWATDLDVEATKQKQSSIYLKLHDKLGKNEPRLYKLDYTRNLHKQAEAIKQIIKEGGRYRGSMESTDKKKGGPDGDGPENGGHGGDFSMQQEPKFYELPAPRLPEKVTGQPMEEGH